MDDECEYNFKDAKIYNDLENKFANILEKDITKNINYFKSLKSDVLLDKNGVIFGVDTE